MDRNEALIKIDDLLTLCRDMECGIHCEHEKDLSKLGEFLEQDTYNQRVKKYGVEKAKSLMNTHLQRPEQHTSKQVGGISLETILEEIGNGLSNQQIAAKYGLKYAALASFVWKHSIINPSNVRKNTGFITKDFLIKQLALGKCGAEIARDFNVAKSTVNTRIKKYGLGGKNK